MLTSQRKQLILESSAPKARSSLKRSAFSLMSLRTPSGVIYASWRQKGVYSVFTAVRCRRLPLLCLLQSVSPLKWMPKKGGAEGRAADFFGPGSDH
jgi:hypothetical protein